MIVHFAHGGRFGNQLFAVAFIQKIRRGRERVICSRLGEVLRDMTGLRHFVNFESRAAILLIDRIVDPFARRVLVPLGIIGSRIEQSQGLLKARAGLLPVTYVRGYFQSRECLPRGSTPLLGLRSREEGAARDLLGEARGRTPLFVHVRRGDYVTWQVLGKPDPSLPLAYYRRAIAQLSAIVANPFYFYLGDEPEWLSEAFPELPHREVTGRAPASDLALMSLCAGGVISNSSFAWWAAHFCRGTAPIFAPLYWLGWRSGAWYPPMIETARLSFLPVESRNAEN